MRLSIVTVNYNGSESTNKLLNSLAEQTDHDFETIVIDNASEQADFAKLPAEMVVRSEVNLGFSGGCNLGIKQALQEGSDWVVLLNNDTWVDRDFISSLKGNLAHLDGVIGIPLDEGDCVAYAGLIQWFKPTLTHFHQWVSGDNIYAIGGAVAINNEVFKKAGYLDEKYFLYFEDADFSIKARKSGFKVSVLKEPKVNHQTSSTTKRLGSPLLLRYHYRNALYFNWKNAPGHIKILNWPWSFWVMKKQILKMMFFYKREESSAVLKGVIDFYKNRMGKIQQ